MSYAMALYEKGDVSAANYSGRELWKMQIDEQMLRLITPHNIHNRDEHEKRILEEYRNWIHFDNDDRMAMVDNLKDGVDLYNWDILLEMATIEFYECFYDEWKRENSDIDEDDEDDYIGEDISGLADEYWNDLYYDLFDENEQYIMDILNKHNKAYAYSLDNEVFNKIDHAQYMAWRNDAQNIMFPEIHEDIIMSKLDHFTKYDAMHTTITFKNRGVQDEFRSK